VKKRGKKFIEMLRGTKNGAVKSKAMGTTRRESGV